MWMAAYSLVPVRVVVVLPGVAGFLVHINVHTLIHLIDLDGHETGFYLSIVVPVKMHNRKNLEQNDIQETEKIYQQLFQHDKKIINIMDIH